MFYYSIQGKTLATSQKPQDGKFFKKISHLILKIPQKPQLDDANNRIKEIIPHDAMLSVLKLTPK